MTVRTRMSTLAAVMASLALVGCGLAVSLADAKHGPPVGTDYGVADAHDGPKGELGADGLSVDARAFPEALFGVWGVPKAFWAGFCDLESPDAGADGIGTPPAAPQNCIDHGTAYAPADILNPSPPRQTTWQPGEEPSWRLATARQAAGHPDMSISFWMQRSPDLPLEEGSTHTIATDGDTKNIVIKLPAGFLGNPNAVPACPAADMQTSPPSCRPESQVGMATVTLGEGGVSPSGGSLLPTDERLPIWNVEPRKGKLAEFMVVANLSSIGRVNIPIVGRSRTEGDFGIDTMTMKLPAGLPVLGSTITLWGVPWDESHDKYRAPQSFVSDGAEGIPASGFPDGQGNQPQPYSPKWGALRPFVVSQTECAPVAPVALLELESWHVAGSVRQYGSRLGEPLSGCGKVPFDPQMGVAATSSVADSASGLNVDLEVAQNLDPKDPGDATPLETPAEGASALEVKDYVDKATAFWESDAGLSSSHLKDAVVMLPEGLSLNPAAASGLLPCSDAGLGITKQASGGNPPLFDNHDPFRTAPLCPNGSKVGSVSVYSPVIPGAVPGVANLTGDVVIGTPKPDDVLGANERLRMRMYLVLRSEERGLVAKVAGTTSADPKTGRLTAVFEQNPRVPFEWMKLRLQGGSRGVVATAQDCGPKGWSGLLTPWTAAHGAGGVADPVGGAFGPSSNCAPGFSPSMVAGMDNPSAGKSGVFSFSITRLDGQQWLSGVSTEMPKGLLADVGSVAKCTNAQAADNACPASSKVGIVDAGAGAGTPFFLERKGSVYLTEGYKGAPFGLATVVPVEAGPFRGPDALTPIVVRQALHVDPKTAQASVVSDPLPTIHHGIPLRAREITLLINRAGFMRNPTSCAPKAIEATLTSTEGAKVARSHPFQADGCKRLPFKPRLRLALTGKGQTVSGKHPGVRAVVTQKPGEAGIKRAEVRLPKPVILDPDKALGTSKYLCEYLDGIRPDLERHCPKLSIIGRATAVSPLLERPLRGNVYFSKNVRIDPVTKRERRTLPMIVVALRGEISVNLYGNSTIKGGRLVNIFKTVPDAPISRFALNIKGGPKGVLEITRKPNRPINICRHKQTIEALMDGQNGKHYDRELTTKTPCKKKAGKRKRT